MPHATPMPIAANRIRLVVWLSAALLPTFLAAASHPAAALAQPLPELPSIPGLDHLLSNPGKWLTDMFNDALVSLGNKTTGDVVGFMNWLMGSGNIISQTPAELTYANPAVRDLSEMMRKAGLAGLAVVTVWSGVNLMVHP